MQHRRSKQTTSIYQRLNDEALRLRQEARDAPPGAERDELVRKARQAENAFQIQDLLKTPGSQPPR